MWILMCCSWTLIYLGSGRLNVGSYECSCIPVWQLEVFWILYISMVSFRGVFQCRFKYKWISFVRIITFFFYSHEPKRGMFLLLYTSTFFLLWVIDLQIKFLLIGFVYEKYDIEEELERNILQNNQNLVLINL